MTIGTLAGQAGQGQRGGEEGASPRWRAQTGGGSGYAFWTHVAWLEQCSILQIFDSPREQRPRGGAEEEGEALPLRGHWAPSRDIFGCHTGSGGLLVSTE